MSIILIEKICDLLWIYPLILPSFIYYSNICDLKYGIYLLFFYLNIDLIREIYKKETIYIVHHLLGIVLIYYSLKINAFNKLYVITMLNTEISTIFLNLRTKYPGNKIFDILFYITFTYFRIYKYYTTFVNKDFLNYIFEIYNDDIFVITNIFLPIFLLGIMNLYWYCIINHMVICLINNSIKKIN
jgi:hypothetical protein